MMCGTVEKPVSGMEGNGGGVPKWWEKVAFRRICSTSLAFFAKEFADFAQNIVDTEMKLRYYEIWSSQECFSEVYMGNVGLLQEEEDVIREKSCVLTRIHQEPRRTFLNFL